MKMSGYVYVALACLLVCFKSVYSGGSNSSSFFTLTENQEITCNGYANCSNDACNFNSTLKSNDSSRYVPGTENVVHCGVITLDVKFPTSKGKLEIGTVTPFCYNYTNSNNTGFDALQVVIQKAGNPVVNSTIATIVSSLNYYVTLNETNDTVTIVVLPSSRCVVFVPSKTGCTNLTINIEPTNVVSFMDTITVQCTCLASSNSSAACPDLITGYEDLGLIEHDEIHKTSDRKNCSVKWSLYVGRKHLNNKRIETPVHCKAGPNATPEQLIAFSVRKNGERCKEQADCVVPGQICDPQTKTCSCFNEQPAFVMERNKCFSASRYGRECQFTEQCEAMDIYTKCKDNKCKCKENFWKINEESSCNNVSGCSVVKSDLLDPNNLLLFSDTKIFHCTCTSNSSSAYCPTLKIGTEALGSVNYKQLRNKIGSSTCSTAWAITVAKDYLYHERIEVPLSCETDTYRNTPVQLIMFQKRANNESCREEIDCGVRGQICNHKIQRCSCSGESSVFDEKEKECHRERK